MNKRLLTVLLAGCVALAASSGACAQTLQEAARQAARQYNAKVLSAHTEQHGQQRVHVIKLLTRNGVVKTVRVPVRKR